MEFQQVIQQCFMDPKILKDYDTVQSYLQKNHQQVSSNFYDSPELYQEDFKVQSRELAKRFIGISKLLKDQYGHNKDLQVGQHVFCENGTFFLNWNAFLSTIEMLGTPSQVEYWLKQIFDLRLVGGYAQTEVAHGSNVQGLQTQAVFNQEDDTFTLNSPTVEAYKIWPGLLGTYGTHMVLQASTTVNGKNIGIQTFVVPIREPSYKPLPGVDVGDQGNKLGFLRPDNGYLGLKDVKVPRDYLLQRYVTVNKDGSFKEATKDAIKFGYGSMLNLRVFLANSFIYQGLSSTNLAYSQTKELSELNVHRITKTYSYLFSMLLANYQVSKTFRQYQEQLQNNDPKVNQTLQEVHLYCSAFKPVTGWEAIKACREAMQIAPFGNLSASRLVNNYGDGVPYATYEGDNNVLLQQSAKYLVKVASDLQKGKQAKGIASYLNKHLEEKPIVVVKDVITLTFEDIEGFLERLALKTIINTTTHMFEYMQDGNGLNKVWNELNQSSINKMVITFTYVNIYRLALKEISQLKLSQEAQSITNRLFGLYGLHLLLQYKTELRAYKIANICENQLYESISLKTGNHKDLFQKITSATVRAHTQYFEGFHPGKHDFNHHIRARL